MLISRYLFTDRERAKFSHATVTQFILGIESIPVSLPTC